MGITRSRSTPARSRCRRSQRQRDPRARRRYHGVMRRIAIIVVGVAALAVAACGSVSSNGDASARGGGGGGGSTGTGGTGGRRSCQADTDCQGFKCCGGFCVNPGNDIQNCGTCGHTCTGTTPYCSNGTC